jgi:hypothetical protein
LATIQEKFDALTPDHQHLLERVVDDLLILERLLEGLDHLVIWAAKPPDPDDHPESQPQ